MFDTEPDWTESQRHIWAARNRTDGTWRKEEKKASKGGKQWNNGEYCDSAVLDLWKVLSAVGMVAKTWDFVFFFIEFLFARNSFNSTTSLFIRVC